MKCVYTLIIVCVIFDVNAYKNEAIDNLVYIASGCVA